MHVIDGDLGPFARLAREYEWVYADSDAAKALAYRMRKQVSGRQIDPYDRVAHHLLMRRAGSGEWLATTRVLAQADLTAIEPLPLERTLSNGFAAQHGKLPYDPAVSEMSYCYVDREVQAAHQEDDDLVALAVCLAGFALARLLFHDFMLVQLPVRQFKQFRAQGLRYEYAGGMLVPNEHAVTFYLDLRHRLRAGSPLQHWQQAISDQLAPHLNKPMLQERRR